MAFILLTAVTVISLINSIRWKIAVMALAYHTQLKGCTPTDDELKACSEWVVKRMLKLKR